MLYILPADADGGDGFDELDMALIRMLQANGRESFVQLARKTGQPERLVARKVEQLVSRGVIQVAPVCNPAKLGFRSMAIILIRLRGGCSAEGFVREMLAHPVIDYVAITLGQWDVLIEVLGTDDIEMRRFIERQVSGHADVAAVEPMPDFQAAALAARSSRILGPLIYQILGGKPSPHRWRMFALA